MRLRSAGRRLSDHVKGRSRRDPTNTALLTGVVSVVLVFAVQKVASTLAATDPQHMALPLPEGVLMLVLLLGLGRAPRGGDEALDGPVKRLGRWSEPLARGVVLLTAAWIGLAPLVDPNHREAAGALTLIPEIAAVILYGGAGWLLRTAAARASRRSDAPAEVDLGRPGPHRPVTAAVRLLGADLLLHAFGSLLAATGIGFARLGDGGWLDSDRVRGGVVALLMVIVVVWSMVAEPVGRTIGARTADVRFIWSLVGAERGRARVAPALWFVVALLTLTPALMTSSLVNGWQRFGIWDVTWRVGLMALLICTGRVCGAVASVLSSRVGSFTAEELRMRAYGRFLQARLPHPPEVTGGKTAAILTGHVNAAREMFATTFPFAQSSFANLAVAVAVALILDLRLGLILLVSIPLLLRTLRFMPSHSKEAGELQRSALERLTGEIDAWTTPAAVRHARSANAGGVLIERAKPASRELACAQVAQSRLGAIASVISSTEFQLLAVITWVGGKALDMPSGDLVAIQATLVNLLFPIGQLVERVPEVIAGAKRLRALPAYLDLPEERKTGAPPGRVGGPITISEAYADGANDATDPRPALAAIPEGRITALMGGSGSGKTTLLRAIAGIEPVSRWRISIGTHLQSETYLPAWRELFGFAQQDPLAQDGTLRNLIDPIGRASDEWLVAKLEQFGLGYLLEANGLERTMRGADYSGGERTRMELVRALIGDPPIVCLDEPDTGLDPQSERETLEAIQALLRSDDKSRTCVIATHSGRIAESAHHVIVLGDSEVLDSGTYADLVDRCVPFRELRDFT